MTGEKPARRMLALALVPAVALLLLPRPAQAYRPFRTEDAGVVGRGVTQMELSLDYTRLESATGTRHLALLVAIHGLTERVEISAEVPFLEERVAAADPERGLGDLQLVAKVLLSGETDRLPAFTARGAVKLDTGEADRGLGTGDEDWSLFVVASKGFGRLTAHAHLGYAWVGDDQDLDLEDTWRYSGGVDMRLAPGRHLISEISGNSNTLDPKDRDEREWRLGLLWYSIESRQFDVSVRRGLDGTGDDWTLAAGMSLTF